VVYVIDIKDPWLGEGYWSYNVTKCAKVQGVSVGDWLKVFKNKTSGRGGTVVYEGDEKERPDWLKEESDHKQREAS